VESIQDQIKRLAQDYSRYDALRTEALEKLQRLWAESPNGKANGKIPEGATIPRNDGDQSAEPTVIGRPPKTGTKAFAVLALLSRPTAIDEIAASVKWNENTVRGFLSSAPKRFQVVIDSNKREDGKRVYFIR
jgi:hypothetical protein